LEKNGGNISSVDATPTLEKDDGDVSLEDTTSKSAEEDTTHTQAKDDVTDALARDDNSLNLAKDDRDMSLEDAPVTSAKEDHSPESQEFQEPADVESHISMDHVLHDRGETPASDKDPKIPLPDTIVTPTSDDEIIGDCRDDQTSHTQTPPPAKDNVPPEDNVPPDCVETERSPQRSSIGEKILLTCGDTHGNHTGIDSSSDGDSATEAMCLDTSEESQGAALSDSSEDVLDEGALETDSEATGEYENATEDEAVPRSGGTSPTVGTLSVAGNDCTRRTDSLL
jgi:hypothetical protein